VSVLQSASDVPPATTSYFYDADGRLRRTVDPTGISSHILYDEAGRKVATIDGANSLTEYLYDADNNLTRTIRYAAPVTTANLLVDAQGQPTSKALVDVRPTANPALDRSTWNAYDSAKPAGEVGRRAGLRTQASYDGAGRLIGVTKFTTDRHRCARQRSLAGSINPT